MASHSLFYVMIGVFLLFLVIQPISAQGNFMISTKKSKFLSSLYKLEGVQKGQTKEGLIKQLKTYLKVLGYSSTNDKTLVINDVFDDGLESSIKLYQKFNNLKVTGKLDSGTIKTMSIPQYNEPKSINRTANKPHKKSGDRSNHYFHEVSHFSITQYKWSKNNLCYGFDLINSPFSRQVMSPICSRAFRRWSAVSPLSFQEVSQGELSDIVISFESIDGPNGILALGFYPEDGRLYFDSAENWSTSSPTSAQFDLESVALHEIGHVIGLNHSEYQEAVMYPTIRPGEVKRSLQQDDINGVHALYPQ